jgi:hypothetical protein
MPVHKNTKYLEISKYGQDLYSEKLQNTKSAKTCSAILREVKQDLCQRTDALSGGWEIPHLQWWYFFQTYP